ncbi:MAG: hypothetical protein EP340_03315 [Alphaproteobacteria bacterium]|nr:MAG: hypothetical protein EP340_03315 [Alphaproteobacteria bacterium]
MSDDNAIVESKSSSSAMPTIIYVLYLVALITALPILVGVVFAYLANPRDDIEKSHYRYQIRTFWLCVLYNVLAWTLIVSILGIVFGWAMLVFSWIFVLVRSLKGLSAYDKGTAIPDVTTWLW